MHDAAYFESNGLPATALLSSAFNRQAQYQAKGLGLESIATTCRTVPHPISCRTPSQMAEKADQAFDSIVGALLRVETPQNALPGDAEASPAVSEDCMA